MRFEWEGWEGLDNYDKKKLKRFTGKRPNTSDDNYWTTPTEYIMKMTDKDGKDTYTLAGVLHVEMRAGYSSYKIVIPHIETHQDGKKKLYGQLELFDWIRADEVELYEKPDVTELMAALLPPTPGPPPKRRYSIGGKKSRKHIKSRKNKKSRKLR